MSALSTDKTSVPLVVDDGAYAPPVWPNNPYLRNIDANTNTNARGQYVLYRGSCNSDGSGGDDCMESCNDSSYYLAHMQALHNCLIAPGIAERLNLSDQASRYLANSFNIGTDWLSGGPDITEAVVTCFSGYCNAKDECLSYRNSSGSLCTKSALMPDGSKLEGNALADCFDAMCNTSAGTVDSDIGGIGVFVSYLLQISIAIAGYVLLRSFQSWMYHFIKCLMKIAGRSLDSAHATAQAVQKRLQPHAAILLPALQEFHRSQCFFVIALQIAAFVAVNTNRFESLDPRQYITNYIFIQVVALNSILCIPFTYWYLQCNAWRSWYTSILTWTSWGLSIATFTSASRTAELYSLGFRQSYIQGNAVLATYDYCGGANPTIECDYLWGSNLNWIESFMGGGDIIFPALLGAALLVQDVWLLSSPHFAWRSRWLMTGRRFIGEMLEKRSKLRMMICRTARLIELGVFALFVAYIVGQILTFARYSYSGLIDVENWGIGQIIAITVWLPSILEFVQLEIVLKVGMVFGFSHRLPKDYIVTKEPSRTK